MEQTQSARITKFSTEYCIFILNKKQQINRHGVVVYCWCFAFFIAIIIKNTIQLFLGTHNGCTLEIIFVFFYCSRMEESSKGLLQHKQRAEQLKQEKSALTVSYEVITLLLNLTLFTFSRVFSTVSLFFPFSSFAVACAG